MLPMQVILVFSWKFCTNGRGLSTNLCTRSCWPTSSATSWSTSPTGRSSWRTAMLVTSHCRVVSGQQIQIPDPWWSISLLFWTIIASRSTKYSDGEWMIFTYNTILSNNGLTEPVIFLQVAINANFLFCAIYDLIGLGETIWYLVILEV